MVFDNWSFGVFFTSAPLVTFVVFVEVAGLAWSLHTSSGMKPHYFSQDEPDADDSLLQMTISQGYVPSTCLLGGQVVMGLVTEGIDPCRGCECDRGKCGGRAKKINMPLSGN